MQDGIFLILQHTLMILYRLFQKNPASHYLYIDLVIDQIQSELNVKVPVINFYKYPTIVSFAAYLGSGEGAKIETERNQNRAMLRKKSLKRSRERASFRR